MLHGAQPNRPMKADDDLQAGLRPRLPAVAAYRWCWADRSQLERHSSLTPCTSRIRRNSWAALFEGPNRLSELPCLSTRRADPQPGLLHLVRACWFETRTEPPTPSLRRGLRPRPSLPRRTATYHPPNRDRPANTSPGQRNNAASPGRPTGHSEPNAKHPGAAEPGADQPEGVIGLLSLPRKRP